MHAFLAELTMGGLLTIPCHLLRSYRELGLSESELVLLLHLWRYKQEENNYFPLPEALGSLMSLQTEEIKALIAGLVEKRYLSIVSYYSDSGQLTSYYSYEGLFSALARSLDSGNHGGSGATPSSRNGGPKPDKSGSQAAIPFLYKQFEREFGRLLSPLELEQIAQWVSECSPELVTEALRRSVLRGILNFKYIDSIIRYWFKNNLHNTAEVIAHEERYNQKKQTGRKPGTLLKPEATVRPKPKKDKYKDVYLS